MSEYPKSSAKIIKKFGFLLSALVLLSLLEFELRRCVADTT
ncbi:hypothetical protein C427_5015 [Paraglaciecola psychrophila 170]|uniref:Uncharacterized protein n=1 Tax=Paraglaciecola psychrophila 170 TaxID=1129794 RepID=K6Z2R8_9ALTE|nr:hypothetical protein C427_5015 [Paraglaciecola psychrophila 170]GAC39319.1 hypothetical protein GPSY_3708 [Paraglaciecola psychrophila 170]